MKMGSHKSKLCPKELSEIVNSTDFTEREIRAWYKSFLRDCPSGCLTLDEFKKYCTGFFVSGDSTEYAERAFRSFDTNENGLIDFREFMCALSVTSRGSFEQKLKWAFRMYDTDHDGSITKNEVYLMIKVGIDHMFLYFLEGRNEELMFSQNENVAEWAGIAFYCDNNLIIITFNNDNLAVPLERHSTMPLGKAFYDDFFLEKF